MARDISEADFSIALLAGLRLIGEGVFIDEPSAKRHARLKAAFDVVKEGLTESRFTFVVIIDELHGTSGSLAIMNSYWLESYWCSIDTDWTMRSQMNIDTARAYLDPSQIEGGEALWMEAARAYRDAHS